MTIGGLSGLDSVLLSYYQAQQNDTPSAVAAASATQRFVQQQRHGQ